MNESNALTVVREAAAVRERWACLVTVRPGPAPRVLIARLVRESVAVVEALKGDLVDVRVQLPGDDDIFLVPGDELADRDARRFHPSLDGLRVFEVCGGRRLRAPAFRRPANRVRIEVVALDRVEPILRVRFLVDRLTDAGGGEHDFELVGHELRRY